MTFENNEHAFINLNDEVPYYTFPSLSNISFIKHGFSTKLGGTSKGYYKTMNLGYTNGDDKKDVDANYDRISKAIGFQKENLVLSDQVHKTNIKVVTEKDKGKGIVKQRDYKEVDGLITNQVGIPLATFYADCVPLYFVDIKNHVIGLSHSGWKGTVKRMGKETLNAMKLHFNTDPNDVISLIGPSICMDCYEVSTDVAKAFENEFSQKQLIDILQERRNEKYQLNLWAANRHILLDAGVKKENIHISGVCTCCNKDILYSHRATGGKRGALAAFLMIESQNVVI